MLISKICFLFVCIGLLTGLISCGYQPENASQLQKPEPIIEPSQNRLPDEPKDESKMIAEWKGGHLTLAQIDRFVKPVDHTAYPQPMDADTRKNMIAQERKTITETLTGNYLLLLEAREQGITLSEAEKEAVLHKAKGNFESEELYKQYLSNANQTEEDFLNILENIELGKKCVEQKEEAVWNGITTASMKIYYDVNIQKFTPAHRSFFNRVDIHVKDGRSLEEAKALAEKLCSEVAGKISSMTDLEEKRNVMREYAKNHSDSFEASYNGGYVTMYHTPEFEEGFSLECMKTAKETPVGELSPVFRSKHGYGFLLPKTQIESFIHPFETEAVQKMIPSMILDEELKKWRDELKQKYELVIHEEALEEEFIPSQQQLTSAPVSTP